MPFNIENLQQARYKDYSFSYKSETTSAGRSKIVNEYSNKDYDKIQDGGKLGRIYRFTITISGDNFLKERKRILDLADEETSGQLIHPEDGRVDNVYLMPLEITTEISSIGYAEIPVVFRVDGPEEISPTSTKNKKLKIDSLQEKSFSVLENSLSGLSSKSVKSKDGIFSKASEILNILSNPNSKIGDALEFSKNISSLTNFVNNIYGLQSSPKTFASSFINIMKSSAQVFNTPDDVISSQEPNVVFNSNRTEQISSFVQEQPLRQDSNSIEAINAQNLFNSTFLSLQALNIFKAYSEVDFSNEDEVVAAIKKINTITDSLYFEDVETRESVIAVADATIDFLSDERISQKKFIEKDFNNTPASLISFQMFGTSEKTQEIMRANKDINISYYNGDVKLLS